MSEPGDGARLEIVGLARRPDLLPLVADWLWEAFWQESGCSRAEIRAEYAACRAEVGAPQMLILLEDGVPVGTATLARHDLEERPALAPWLAGVFVVPERRGRGYVRHLLAAFDAACGRAAIGTAWLYTNTAEPVYRRAGWRDVEIVERAGRRPVTLMRRDYP